jgi:hypothetical protein
MGGGTQTSVSEAKPYGPLKPLLNTSIKDALSAYKQGIGANAGSMVVPFSRQTERAFGGIMDVAGRNANAGNGLNNQLQDMIKQGGFNDYQKNALRGIEQTATGGYNPNKSGFQDVMRAMQDDAQDQVNLSASAAGRYGSGAHQGAVADAVGDIANQMRMSDFRNYQTDKSAAQSNLFNAGQAGLGNMTSAYQGLKMPYTDMMGTGAAKEDLQRRFLDDRARVANLPWEQLSKLLAVGSGTGSYNTTSTTAPGPNPFLQALGMGATGANLLFGSQPLQQGGILGLL